MSTLPNLPNMVPILTGSLLLLSMPHAEAQDNDDTEHGADLFSELCSECHQLHPHGLDPGQLDLSYFSVDEREHFETVVRQGMGTMPPAGEHLDDDEMDALWAYFAEAVEQVDQ